MSIIEVERCSLLVFTALLPASPSINAETITSLADSLYLHDGTYRSIVLGSRIGDEFYVLDVGLFQLLQFPVAPHFPTIDVDDGSSLAEYLILIVFRNNARHMFQYVTGSSQLA